MGREQGLETGSRWNAGALWQEVAPFGVIDAGDERRRWREQTVLLDTSASPAEHRAHATNCGRQALAHRHRCAASGAGRGRSVIRGYRDEIEREQRLPKTLVEQFHAAGFYSLVIPRDLGGLQADPLTYLRVVELLAEGAGSVGWNLANNSIGAGHARVAVTRACTRSTRTGPTPSSPAPR